MRRSINIWKNLDWLTVFLYFILVIMGWLNIYAAVYSEQHQSIFDFDMRYGKQMLWISMSLIMIIVIMLIDTRFYTFFAYVIFGISLILLFLVAYFGKEVNHSRSWFEIAGFHFQPSEFAKVATNLALAKYLSSYGVKIDKTKTILVSTFIIFAPAVLILLQPDFGSVIVYLSLIFVLYREGFPGGFLFFLFLLAVLFILALVLEKIPILIILIIISQFSIIIFNKRYREAIVSTLSLFALYGIIWGISRILNLHILNYYALLFSLIITYIGLLIWSILKKYKVIIWVSLFLGISIGFTSSVEYVFDNFLEQHQKHRINILLGKESDLKGQEYNINQSKIAIGSGGFSGKGYLQGTQTKYNFVPEQSTDFIFCTVGEEWGFLGSFFVLTLFTLLLLRLIILAERQRSVFSRIYGYGLIAILFFHIAINIGMTIGLLPVIGIPLPFFSYGGSSLWAFTLLLFIFLRFDSSRLELLR
jgi:rod shape determining protein RodA